MSEKILILGAGGREHAMAHKLSTEGVGHEVIVAPGNPGIEKISSVKCHKLNVSHHEEVIKFSKEKQFDLIIVGPEAPLAAGLGDELRNEGFLVVGPGKIGAKLESSKAFSKDFMYRHGIPTAQYGSYTEIEKALSDVKTEKFGTNPVIKASGLAAGKGVFVCKDLDEAKTSVERLMGEESFSIKSPEIVIEEQLFGNELSVFALVDESGYKIIGHGEDYKRLEDNDLGPNTGGMGAVFRKGIISQELLQKIQS
ncbi:MAG: phosphoribosylamine--glycine ligase, partial [Bacteriovoracaceae bacterium]